MLLLKDRLRMRRNANGRPRVVKRHELRLEEDVAVDLQVRTAVGLDRAEADCTIIASV
jgi:hypothetical protein